MRQTVPEISALKLFSYFQKIGVKNDAVLFGLTTVGLVPFGLLPFGLLYHLVYCTVWSTVPFGL